MSKAIAYLLQTPDGTILRSYHRHDYVTYTDKVTKKEYMIDGGNDYCRSSVNGDEIYIIITDDMPFEVQRQFVVWGTRGKDGKQPLRYIPVCVMEDDHIQAILDTQPHASKFIKQVLTAEQVWRKEHVQR